MENNKEILIERTKNIFFRRYNHYPDVISVSPGRVNIIGEHVDYTKGLSMPVAIDKYLCVAISKNNKNTIDVYSENLKESYTSKLHKISNHKIWHKYVQGSILESVKDLDYNGGLELVINSNIPMGKGISSSAALELSIVCSTLKLFNVHLKDEEIINRCQRVDHNYVGIKSGKLDQSACLLSKNKSVFIIDFADLSIDYIPINFEKVSWVLIDSGIRRELATSKYHRRVEQCEEAFKILLKENKNLENFRDIDESKYFLIDLLPSKLKRRVTHIISENKRVLSMKNAIKNNQFSEIGNILCKSHESLRDNYEVSCEEIDFLVDSSRELEYWYGGRIMGGGFGGSTINLIKEGAEEVYIELISEMYEKKFNVRCESMIITFVDGVKTIDNIRAN